jgi:hypothetical protein
LAIGLFAWREVVAAEPLLPPRVVVDRQRGAAYLSALLAIGGIFGAFLVLTYELQVVLGFTPLAAGLALGGVLALAGTVIALAVLVVRGLKTTTAGAGPGRFLLWLAHSE